MEPFTGTTGWLFCGILPFKNGMPTGKWEVFADGFAGENVNRATHRPCGLAQAPDGSLFVSDDAKGNIWRVSHKK
jgi:glucose/arabinose dehydrogenase